jgi:hypothetical protein
MVSSRVCLTCACCHLQYMTNTGRPTNLYLVPCFNSVGLLHFFIDSILIHEDYVCTVTRYKMRFRLLGHRHLTFISFAHGLLVSLLLYLCADLV